MSAKILGRSIRSFIARGTGIVANNIRPTFQSSPSPDGLYASVRLIDEMRLSYPAYTQNIGATETIVSNINWMESVYSVNIYRRGAKDAAQRLIDWGSSYSGIAWANTSITDGRIRGINVVNSGGTGYRDGEPFRLVLASDIEQPTDHAIGNIRVDARGRMTQALLTRFGEGYTERPEMETTNLSGTGAEIAARGFGFTIKYPIHMREMTDIESADYEERAQFDLRVRHTRRYIDSNAGRIEYIIGDRDGVQIESEDLRDA